MMYGFYRKPLSQGGVCCGTEAPARKGLSQRVIMDPYTCPYPYLYLYLYPYPSPMPTPVEGCITILSLGGLFVLGPGFTLAPG